MLKIMGQAAATVAQMQTYIKKSQSKGVRFGHQDDSTVHFRRSNRGSERRYRIRSELPGNR